VRSAQDKQRDGHQLTTTNHHIAPQQLAAVDVLQATHLHAQAANHQ
jgi:hypothetical protein